MTTIGLVNNSEDVLIGNASRRQIDVGDIQEITKQTQDKLPLNSTGTLSHEVDEGNKYMRRSYGGVLIPTIYKKFFMFNRNNRKRYEVK